VGENFTFSNEYLFINKWPGFRVLCWALLQLYIVFWCLQNPPWNLRRTGDFETTLNGIWHLFSCLCPYQKVEVYFHMLNIKKGFERMVWAIVTVRGFLFLSQLKKSGIFGLLLNFLKVKEKKKREREREKDMSTAFLKLWVYAFCQKFESRDQLMFSILLPLLLLFFILCDAHDAAESTFLADLRYWKGNYMQKLEKKRSPISSNCPCSWGDSSQKLPLCYRFS